MASFNKVFLMGNLTRDPQVKHLPSQMVVAEFGLACNRRFKTAGGEDRDEVTFVDCAAFGRQAEVISQYCTKGKPIFVEGRLKFDQWDDKQGNGKRSKITVVVEQFQFLGRGESGTADLAGNAPGAATNGGAGPSEGTENMFANERGSGRSGDRERGGTGFQERPARQTVAVAPYGEEKQFEEADIPF